MTPSFLRGNPPSPDATNRQREGVPPTNNSHTKDKTMAMAKKLTAHEIAQKLLAGPDLEIWFQDEESAYSGFVMDVDRNKGQICEYDDFPDEEDEDNAIPWENCITLSVGSTDTILRGDSIIER